MKVFITVFGLIFAAGTLLYDCTHGHPVTYKSASVVRKLLRPELYDDSYLPSAIWPSKDSKPFKAVVSFNYLGKAYQEERIIRCYRDKLFILGGSLPVWHMHLSSFAIPLKDGGMFFSEIPLNCDPQVRDDQEKESHRKPHSFTYVNNIKTPTYLEEYHSSVLQDGNVALSQQSSLIDPTTVELSVRPIIDRKVSYSSNREQKKHASIFRNNRYGPYEDRSGVVTFSFLHGVLFFEVQWRKNPALVEFLKGATEPVLVPAELLENVSARPGISNEAENQVREFYQSTGLTPVNLMLDKIFKVPLTLTNINEWSIIFSNIGSIRSFRRGCDQGFRNCINTPITLDFKKRDRVKIKNLSAAVSSQPVIYLPEMRLIIKLQYTGAHAVDLP